jgi:hypothetical protein
VAASASAPLASKAQTVVPIAADAEASNTACGRPRHRKTKARTQNAVAIATPAQKRASSKGLSPAPAIASRAAPWLSPMPAPRIAPGPIMRRWPSARSCANKAHTTVATATANDPASAIGSN